MTDHTPAPKAVEALPELPLEIMAAIGAYGDERADGNIIGGARAMGLAIVAIRQFAALAAAQAEQAKPVEDAIYTLLSDLAGVDTWDVNLRDHDDAWAAVEKFVAALSPQPPSPDVERQAVAFMYQHEETGLVGFVDQQQVEWGFFDANPRLTLVCPLYRHPPQEAGDADAERRSFDAWCPYKGSPDPWAVWQAAWRAARSPQQEPKA